MIKWYRNSSKNTLWTILSIVEHKSKPIPWDPLYYFIK